MNTNKQPMTMASVFSGIGGEMVAAAMMGWEIKFFCEKNEFGNRVLSYWFPNAESYEDITTTDFRKWRGRIDVLTGGFPCQPFSYAGKRRGAGDDRYLWPSMYRAIDEIQPTWVVAENVAGILTMVEQGEVAQVASAPALFTEGDDIRGQYQLRQTFTLERICTDLEGHGYAVQPVLIPACAVGAPHRRDRVFIVARRIASDSDNRTDGRTAREDESKGREERIQERHEVRKPDEPNQVRPEGATIPEDSMHSRQLYGQDEVEGSERNIGNVGAGGSERICGEVSGIDSSDTMLRGSVSPRTSEASEGNGIEELSQSDEQGTGHAPCWDSRLFGFLRHVADTTDEGLQGRNDCDTQGHGQSSDGCTRQLSEICGRINIAGCGRWADFPSVPPVHRGDDGLLFPVDRLTIPLSKWRTESLRAYGNAIVPQVMYELFRAIAQAEQPPTVPGGSPAAPAPTVPGGSPAGVPSSKKLRYHRSYPSTVPAGSPAAPSPSSAP